MAASRRPTSAGGYRGSDYALWMGRGYGVRCNWQADPRGASLLRPTSQRQSGRVEEDRADPPPTNKPDVDEQRTSIPTVLPRRPEAEGR